MVLSKEETEAIAYLREWAREGCPKRPDQSFPTDFIVAFRRLAQIPYSVSTRGIEEALQAGIDFDTQLPSYRHWGSKEVKEFKLMVAEGNQAPS